MPPFAGRHFFRSVGQGQPATQHVAQMHARGQTTGKSYLPFRYFSIYSFLGNSLPCHFRYHTDHLFVD